MRILILASGPKTKIPYGAGLLLHFDFLFFSFCFSLEKKKGF